MEDLREERSSRGSVIEPFVWSRGNRLVSKLPRKHSWIIAISNSGDGVDSVYHFINMGSIQLLRLWDDIEPKSVESVVFPSTVAAICSTFYLKQPKPMKQRMK